MTESKASHATKQDAGKAHPAPVAAPKADGSRPAVVRDATTMLRAPIEAVRGVLPDSPVPVALGVGALAIGGVIDWPVAGALGLGYLALRRWHPASEAGRVS